MNGWQVTLPEFEGPLDLLLFLVTRKEYDIMDLPMAEITESYLGAVESIGVDNLEDAGDYILMASTLLAIKVRMLLPRPEVEETEEIEDPRRDLAERLLLYQKIKETAAEFSEQETDMLARAEIGLPAVPTDTSPDPAETLFPMTVYDLTRAIEEILRRKENFITHDVSLYKVTVKDRIKWIVELLHREERFGLRAALEDGTARIIWIVTVLALLELAKQGRIRLDQNEPFSELYVNRTHEREHRAA